MTEVTEPTPAVRVRNLIRESPRAALGTALRDAAGQPFASLVTLACDQDASPLLLLSSLALHTRNLEQDPRASLLVERTSGLEDPLAGARASLIGRVVRSDEPRHRARFLARHPAAAGYAGFGDFAIFRFEIERAHLVAGFGVIEWVEGKDVLSPFADALAAAEADILEHMNDEHRDAIQLYARHLTPPAGDNWRMTGIDPEGADLRLGARTARLGFGQPVHDAGSARRELVQLVHEARRRPAGDPSLS